MEHKQNTGMCFICAHYEQQFTINLLLIYENTCHSKLLYHFHSWIHPLYSWPLCSRTFYCPHTVCTLSPRSSVVFACFTAHSCNYRSRPACFHPFLPHSWSASPCPPHCWLKLFLEGDSEQLLNSTSPDSGADIVWHWLSNTCTYSATLAPFLFLLSPSFSPVFTQGREIFY